MSKMTIIEGNSNDKDNVRTYMVKGEQGISPTVETSKTGSTTTISITDAEGTKNANIEDGFSPIANVTKTGDTATITVTDENGTTTATVKDGEDGAPGFEVPAGSVIGFDGTTIPGGYEEITTDYASQITPNTVNVTLAANPQLLVKIGNLVFCRINFNLARDMSNMGSSFDTVLFTLPNEVCPSTNFRFVHSSSYPDGTDLIYFQASDKKIYCSGVKLGTSGTAVSIMGIWKV